MYRKQQHLKTSEVQQRAPDDTISYDDIQCDDSFLIYTKYPLNALTNLLARNFAEQGGGRRHTGVCQGRQHRYAEFNAINVKVF